MQRRTIECHLLRTSMAFALAMAIGSGCDKDNGGDTGDDDDSEESDSDDSDTDDESDAAFEASVDITPTKKVPNPAPEFELSGKMEKTDDGVKLTVSVTGCPAGMHGFHIHAGTACGDEGKDAKGHWDPLEVGEDAHGQVGEDEPHHAGDVGMLECDAQGVAKYTITTDEWSLDADDKLNPVGRAIIVHGIDAKQRIACGVIEEDGDTLKLEASAIELSSNPAADLSGSARFTADAEDGEVTVKVELEGCPAGKHGFHIHAGTSCGDDGSDAMGHWDPLEVGADAHGQVGEDEPHHAGDVGVIECDADGKGSLSLTTDEWTLKSGDKLNPVGQAVILHGIDSANRVGCGVIAAK